MDFNSQLLLFGGYPEANKKSLFDLVSESPIWGSSFRLLNSNYIGQKGVEVERTVDNEKRSFNMTDIGIVGSQIIEFCEEVSSDGKVVWLLDQSGNENHIIQPIIEEAPYIYRNSELKTISEIPAMEFLGTHRMYSVNEVTLSSQVWRAFSMITPYNTDESVIMSMDNLSSIRGPQFIILQSQQIGTRGVFSPDTISNLTGPEFLYIINESTMAESSNDSLELISYLNGGYDAGTGFSGTIDITPNKLSLGSYSVSSINHNFSGLISEGILYNSPLSSDSSIIRENIKASYDIVSFPLNFPITL